MSLQSGTDAIFAGLFRENKFSFLYFRPKIIINMVLRRLIGAFSSETRCCKGF
jgi:hypothetical protein